MTRRYFLTPVIGTGTHADPYRSSAAAYGVDLSAIIPVDASGTPRFAWCLVWVNAADLAALRADAGVNEVPGVALSTTLSQLTGAQRTGIQNRLTALGVSIAGFTLATTLRQLLVRVAQTLDATASIDAVGSGDMT